MIPLSVPNLSGNEWKYVKDCLDTSWVSSVGSYVDKFEEATAEYCGVKKAIAASNGTAALHISLLLAGVKAGDLVILPNVTFVAPANVIKYTGADPILIDVYGDTWQLDISLVERFLTEECILTEKGCTHRISGRRVSAVIPVHVLGNMVDMDSLLPLTGRYNLKIIEDATESLGSLYNDRPAGSFGLFGCLSFNGNKIITTGGGGMVLTNDVQLAGRARHLTTQAKSDAIEYYHDEVGYNYRLVNILAAMGLAQLEQLPAFLKRKQEIAERYSNELRSIPGFYPQTLTEGVEPNNWLYTASFQDSKGLCEHLRQRGIQTRPFWVPMNQLPAFQNDIYYQQIYVSDTVYKNCLSLPCSSNLNEDEQTMVIKAIEDFYG